MVAASSLAFLFAEMVSYTQGRVSGIGELEKKLSLLGYHHGQRLLPLLHSRLESPSGGGSASSSKNPKREIRLLPALLWVHGQAWKALFGKQADSLERSTERSDEYMISTNTPLYSKGMSIPKDMSQLSVEAYTAGIVEAILDGMGFPARVTAHSVATPEYPQRTTILIKLDKSVMEREEALGT
ncbi:TRAPP I complex [Microstroma glucosiphilum]|uniref:Trafficking protein particle complex subunit n=1 Tax=Pseudomicrostroma glucosiphilum TaxID=1684307 RepID=A0A316UCN4_9BASI|nr:TRAPP I complex [Pseudomicrostroma glucosiphilum]PWN22990.1 TRAPP I complex [Pseudomicrostroma glucosiphilum]